MTPRRRIGVLLPSTNSTVEPDFNMVAPAGVSIHAQRLWLTNEMSPESTDPHEHRGRGWRKVPGDGRQWS